MFVIYILLIALAWGAILALGIGVATRGVKKFSRRLAIAVAVGAALLPLPIIDELVGMAQFEQLCRANSNIQVDHRMIAGTSVYYKPGAQIEQHSTWLRIVLQPHSYIDTKTGETALTFSTLSAEGGRLAQGSGTSEGRTPLLFRGSCGPTEDVRRLFKDMNVSARD